MCLAENQSSSFEKQLNSELEKEITCMNQHLHFS